MRLVTSSIIYLSSSIIAKTVPFFLLPFVANRLPAEELGKAVTFLLYLNISAAFVGGNAHSFLSRIYYHLSVVEIQKYVSHILMINFLYCVGLIMLYFPLEYYLNFGFGYYLIFLPLIALLQAIFIMATTLSRFDKRPFEYMAFELFYAAFFLIGVMSFFILDGGNWAYQLWGPLLGYLCVLFLFLLRYGEKIIYRPDFKLLRALLHFTIPQMLHILNGLSLAVSDRFFIGKILGNEELAVYAVTYTFLSVSTLFADAYIKSYSPTIFQMLSKAKKIRLNSIKILLWSITAASVGFISMYFLAPIGFNVLFPPSYMDGLELQIYLLAAFFFFTCYKLIFPFIVAAKLQNFLVLASTLIAITSFLILSKYLIYYGIILAAQVTLLSYFSLSCVSVLSLYRARNKCLYEGV